jgi:hypothetical protein
MPLAEYEPAILVVNGSLIWILWQLRLMAITFTSRTEVTISQKVDWLGRYH